MIRWPVLHNLPDLLSTRRHTADFLGSRCQHIHDRIRFLALLFAVSVLLWVPFDVVIASSYDLGSLFGMRVVLAICYLGLVFWVSHYENAFYARIRLFLLVMLPCLFYLVYRWLLQGEASDLARIIYDFYPFVIIVQLAIFPLTLVEGFLLSLPAFAVVLLSSESTHGTLSLLGLLAILTLWAQASQLHMLLRLYRQATRDPLTGLFNRRMLMERLESELDRARRYGRSLSILLLDLDKFKRVNDAYGHLTGDQVLKRFASIIDSSLRSVDMVGRYGGEEFLAVLPETDTAGAKDVAERISSLCHKTEIPSIDGRQISFTTSIGIASSVPDEDISALIHRADEALYGAKEAGRDRIIVADQPDPPTMEPG